MIIFRKLAVMLSLIMLSAPVLALTPNIQSNKTTSMVSDQATKDAVDDLVKKLEAIKTLTASFSHKVVNGGSAGNEKRYSGSLSIKRPNLFIWRTDKPYSQVIYVYDGKVVSVDNSLMQVIIKKQSQYTGQTPYHLLSGNAREYLKNYTVFMKKHKNEQDFTLEPGGSAQGQDEIKPFMSLTIRFRDNVLSGFSMIDGLGNTHRIDLKNIHINAGINDDKFKPVYPKNYDVIGS